MAIKFLSGSATQGSADAFVASEMATGLLNNNIAYRVRAITYQWPAFVEVDADYAVGIFRRSVSAFPASLIGDRTVLDLRTKIVKITTSGSWITDQYDTYFFAKDLDLLIVEDPIYFAADTTGTSAANAFRVRILYEEVRLTDTQKLAALTESLNA